MLQSVSCYERLRLENIERNQIFLKKLGLETGASTIPDKRQNRSKRKIEVSEDLFDARRSHRIANISAVTSYREVGSLFRKGRLRYNLSLTRVVINKSIYRSMMRFQVPFQVLEKVR